MSQSSKFLLGSIIERKPDRTAVSPKRTNPNTSGFPVAQHRSKSAFARNREAQKSTSAEKELRAQAPPIVVSTPTIAAKGPNPEPPASDRWREQMNSENEMRLANMTDEEREEEKREILQRFGAGVGDVLKRARLARERHAAKELWPGHQQRAPPLPSEADTEAFKKMPEGALSYPEITRQTLTPYWNLISANI